MEVPERSGSQEPAPPHDAGSSISPSFLYDTGTTMAPGQRHAHSRAVLRRYSKRVGSTNG